MSQDDPARPGEDRSSGGTHRHRRRAASPGLGSRAATVLGVLVPVAAVTAFLGVNTPPEPPGARPPAQVALTRATQVCPAVDAPVLAATAGEVAGTVEVRQGAATSTVTLRPGAVARVDPDPPTGRGADAGPVVVAALDDLAPGLVAARFPTVGPPGAPECRTPTPDLWFAGLGAEPGHSSEVSLTNPDRGRAVVDVVVHGRRGVVDAPTMLGIAVPGRDTVTLDLDEVVPRRGPLAAQVTSTRGRTGASVLDRFDELGAGASGSDWTGGQEDPGTEVLLLGLPRGAERRELVLANTSDDQARSEVEVLTEDSVFRPDGLGDVTVAPQGTQSVDLSELLPAGTDAVGLRVRSTRPVAAALRSVVGDDLAVTSATEALPATTTVLLPGGSQQLVLAGAESSGSVLLTPRRQDGSLVGENPVRADLVPDRATVVDVPPAARRLDVGLRGTSASAAVVVGGGADGAAVVRVRALGEVGLVGDVRPALP